MRPVQPQDRLQHVDILRGFALLGVLMMNTANFSGYNLNWQRWPEPLDAGIILLLLGLVGGKFYSTLAFLYGWGMANQILRAQARGDSFIPRYLRRLGVLLFFGCLHVVLLWHGDVLTSYAIFGLLLLLFSRSSPRMLIAIAGSILLFKIIINFPGGPNDQITRAWIEAIRPFLVPHYDRELYAEARTLVVLPLRLRNYPGLVAQTLLNLPNMFPMFLLGLYAGKRRLLHEPEKHRSFFRNAVLLFLPLGLVFNVVNLGSQPGTPVFSSQLPFLTQISGILAAPTLSLGYIAFVLLLYVPGSPTRERRTIFRFLPSAQSWQRGLQPLAAVGRMSLTNYILQSVAGVLVFYRFGLGLHGRTDPTFGLTYALLFYLAQIRFSAWWFEHHDFGPLEWLWRRMAYGRRQPGPDSRPAFKFPSLERSKLAAYRLLRVKIPVLWGMVFVVLVALVGGALLRSWLGRVLPGILPVSQSDPTPPTLPVKNPAIPEGNDQPDPVLLSPMPYHPGPFAAAGDLLALSAAFNASKALEEVRTLSSPPYSGRRAASSQGQAAGNYLARRFSELGLQPAGRDGTYFQPFPLSYAQLQAKPALQLLNAAGSPSKTYLAFKDFAPLAGAYSGAGSASGPAVWGGACTPKEFSTVDITGKIVVCPGPSARDSVEDAARYTLEYGGLALLLLIDPQEIPLDGGRIYGEPWLPVPLPTLLISPEVAADLLSGTDKLLSDLSLTFTPLPLPAQLSLEVAFTGLEGCGPSGCLGSNVLGVLPGRNPDFAQEIVILAAHYDHYGQAPGIVWPGANDNASGVAALLEIARTWQEQGYQPQRTVLFAAWDGGELEGAGVQAYIDSPSFPLENTVAVIDLDRIGAGGDELALSGRGSLADVVTAAAQAFKVTIVLTETLTGGVEPFLSENRPAVRLSWMAKDESRRVAGRPDDTVDGISQLKLRDAGRVAMLTLLRFTEAEPEIEQLLARRSQALQMEDLDTFLRTSIPALRSQEKIWYQNWRASQSVNPRMNITGLTTDGREAVGYVQFRVDRPVVTAGSRTAPTPVAYAFPVRFIHTAQGWLWGGQVTSEGFPDAQAGLQAAVERRQAEILSLLGLPVPETPPLVLVYPNRTALNAATAFTLDPAQTEWIEPGMIALAFSEELTTTQAIEAYTAHLILAQAGLTDDAVPWLWHGLPLLTGENTSSSDASTHFQSLVEAMTAGRRLPDETAYWASVRYLQERLGWAGLGQWIDQLGEHCSNRDCADSAALEAAVRESLQLGTPFQDSWQEYWRTRLISLEEDLAQVLQTRHLAIQSGDEIAFIETIDTRVPNLVAEQQVWFSMLRKQGFQSIAFTALPIELSEDGSVLARVEWQYRRTGAYGDAREGLMSGLIRFSHDMTGFRWAGFPFKEKMNTQARLYFPAGQEFLADYILSDMEVWLPRLAEDLNLESPGQLIVKLYPNQEAALALPSSEIQDDALRVLTAPGTSLQLVVPEASSYRAIQPYLAYGLVRALLEESGVTEEWLLTGLGLFTARDLDSGQRQMLAAAQLRRLLPAFTHEKPFSLQNLPVSTHLAESEALLVRTAAWDSIRYLASRHGFDFFLKLLEQIRQRRPIETAFRDLTGQTIAEFEDEWIASLSVANTDPGWVDLAQSIDEENILSHIVALTAPDMAGRQAGSPGERLAAEYIAERFRQAGLLPAGDPITTPLTLGDQVQFDQQSRSFLQTFPISFTTYAGLPRLVLIDLEDRIEMGLDFRTDFSVISGVPEPVGVVSGELVWIPALDYGELDLTGKIILRSPQRTVEEEIDLASRHHAAALILLQEWIGEQAGLAKKPLPTSDAGQSQSSMPVLALSGRGYARMLEALGMDASDLATDYPALPLGIKVQVHASLTAPSTVRTANVLGFLPGTDPSLRQEVVILGAHYDFVGDDPPGLPCPAALGDGVAGACESNPGWRYSGANDNASGVAVLLEIARLLQAEGVRPRRSVLFAAWGAQEAGNLGSGYFAARSPYPLESTVLVINVDAVGGGEGYYLEALGLWEQEGEALYALTNAQPLIEGRFRITALDSELAERSGLAFFREKYIPGVLISWSGANEDNWPDELADEIKPERLSLAGRLTAFLIMQAGRFKSGQ